MLNRINEINIVKSFFGVYDLYGCSSITRRGKSFVNDNKLKLNLKFQQDVQKDKFSLAEIKNISAFFFGELYNYEELVKKVSWQQNEISFSQLCCLLYKRFGISFAKFINGMFSIILRDQENDTLLLIVDRFGAAKPIYYNISSSLKFSSELKHFFIEDFGKREIDTDALSLFLKYSYIPSPKTITKGVNKLKPGELICCKGSNFKIERYIDFYVRKSKMSEDEAVYEYTKLLTESISVRFDKLPDQKVGVLLSGGLDSSANVALASKNRGSEFETFGVGFEDPAIDERPYARIVADHFGVPFNEYVFSGNEIEELPKIIWHLEEPFLENGLFTTYCGFKSTQNKADVIISGNCTDQLFGSGGFHGRPIAFRYLLDKYKLLKFVSYLNNLGNYNIFYRDNMFFKIKVLLRRSIDFNDWFFYGFDQNELNQLCNFPISKNTFNIFSNDLNNIPLHFSDYYQHSVIHQDIEHYACQNLLVKSYRMAEIFKVNGRDPYLDYNLVNFILSVDLKYKRQGDILQYIKNKTVSKYLHRKAMKKILPDSILNKPKQGGSVNMALLLINSQKRKKIYKYILSSDIILKYYNISAINKLFSKYESLISGKNYSLDYQNFIAGKILYLLTLALWFDIFIIHNPNWLNEKSLSDILENY
jgi:asparagine synthase (glutamine-hydrolysing)